MLSTGKLDAFAINKAILFEMSNDLPGSRVLDGRLGLESFALAMPKGRQPAAAYVGRFVEDMKAEGLVAQAVRKVGLRGTVNADLR